MEIVRVWDRDDHERIGEGLGGEGGGGGSDRVEINELPGLREMGWGEQGGDDEKRVRRFVDGAVEEDAHDKM